MFIQPTIIVPILLIVLIILAFIGIVALFVKKIRERRKRMNINIEKMKKLSASINKLNVSSKVKVK
jgi:flagellar biogenesis protein FliO